MWGCVYERAVQLLSVLSLYSFSVFCLCTVSQCFVSLYVLCLSLCTVSQCFVSLYSFSVFYVFVQFFSVLCLCTVSQCFVSL